MGAKKKEVAVVTHTPMVVPELSAEGLIAQAITQGASVETMEKLMAMRRELKVEWAKEQFDSAMMMFQSECPIIKKTKSGAKIKDTGLPAYKYAPLDAIVLQTKKLIEKHGFSYKIDTKTLDGKVEATCIAKHKAGHQDQSTIEVPLGVKTGVMSDSQQVAAALTFAKRYAFCNVFGILTSDEDTDAPAKPTTMKDLEQRVLDGINGATQIDVIIKWDEYVKKPAQKLGKEDFSEAFKKKVGTLATKRVAELESHEQQK